MAEYTIDKIEYGGNVYKLQDNVSGYTTSSGTVTSVEISNATNGGLSISGSPITSSGTITVGHSNVLTSAQTTSAVYPIKIDKNGHISEYGSAVSIINTRGTPTSGGNNLSLVNTGDMYTWNNKQDTLVSGTNIKTINNTSIVGSGNVNTVAAQIIRW